MYLKKAYVSFISESSAKFEAVVEQENEMLPSGDKLFMQPFI